MVRLLFWSALLAVTIGACGGAGVRPDSASHQPARTQPEPPRVVVANDDLSLPSGCRPGEVGRLIQTFFVAVNRGDPAAADFVAFDIAPGGGWYSMTEGAVGQGGHHFVARNRHSLRRYFARRHRRHEVLQLREVKVSYANGLGQLEFRLARRADDLRLFGIVGATVIGKGAVACARHKLVVWSMAMPARGDLNPEQLCHRSEGNGPRAAVACVRVRRS